jgi:calcineurin-like phosphoesterase family protein
VRPPVEPGAIQGGNLDFYIADTHFGHANIVTYCGRPFKDVLEMDEYIIERWNKTISFTDNVFHLGDLCLHYAPIEKELLWKKLNGNKVLILGNHDIDRVGHWAKLGINAIKRTLLHKGMILSHRPEMFPELPNIHGHTHGNMHRGEVSEHGIHVCVSVEAINYTPVSEEWVREQIWKARIK